jgi:septum formation protein
MLLFNMSDFIYLASGSFSRQELLRLANISFVVIKQTADENKFDRNMGLEKVVTQIALEKMRCAVLPCGKVTGERIYVLTADTMGTGNTGEVFGKPVDQVDAMRMLKTYRAGAQTGTAFCLDLRIWTGTEWQLLNRVTRYVSANYVFNVPDQMLDLYFKHTMSRFGASYLDVSGAVAIEDYGLQFVTNFSGSFTGVMGLPMYELREEMLDLGFKFS